MCSGAGATPGLVVEALGVLGGSAGLCELMYCVPHGIAA